MPYTVEGKAVEVSMEPQQKGGTMWVPLRPLAQALGGTVDWDEGNETAIVHLGGHNVTVKAGDAGVDVDGTQSQLQEAPYVEDGETWVPVRFFNQTLNYAIGVDLGSSQVDLSTPTA